MTYGRGNVKPAHMVQGHHRSGTDVELPKRTGPTPAMPKRPKGTGRWPPQAVSDWERWWSSDVAYVWGPENEAMVEDLLWTMQALRYERAGLAALRSEGHPLDKDDRANIRAVSVLRSNALALMKELGLTPQAKVRMGVRLADIAANTDTELNLSAEVIEGIEVIS